MTFNIEWWDIDKVIPYAKNARKIRQSAIDKVAASIQEFGWRQPIVVDAKGVIAVGHVRWGAANKLKLEKVPVHVASDLTRRPDQGVPADGQSQQRGDGLGLRSARAGAGGS